jgi:citronellol/citronellal dehydrogenase
VTNLADGDKMAARSRSSEIMADAAVEILSGPPADVNGKCFIDSAVLAETGVTDLPRYGGGDNPILDIFVDKP